MATIVAWICLAFGALVAAGNIGCLVTSYRTRRHISMIPVLGGPIAFGACVVLPIGWQLGLIALVVDPCCAPMVAGVAIDAFRRRRARRGSPRP